MRFIAKRVAVSAVSCLSLLFILLHLSAMQAVAAPAETSHWNSNTFGNLNALTDKTTITFSVGYNEEGTIEWYKDGVLAETFASTTTACYTTSWPATGMKEVKAKMTNGNGTSEETIWPVEVQEMGTANVAEHVTYPYPRVGGHYTMYVSTGWVNFSTLYLKTKKPADWLEYVSSGTYIMKANMIVGEGATLRMDDGSARLLKMRALPLINNQPGRIDIAYGATCTIDSMTVVGWDVNAATEVTTTDWSATITSTQDTDFDMKNTEFRHIYIQCGIVNYYKTTSARPVCTIDHCKFQGTRPYLLWMEMPGAIVTNNEFYDAHGLLAWVLGADSLVEGNKFQGKPSETFGDNLVLGEEGSRLIGNEFGCAGWNLVEIGKNAFSRDNIMNDPGGIHNGFNSLSKNVVCVNDYCRDFTRYSGFYSQLIVSDTEPTPWENYAEHIYLINAHAKNVPRGFCFAGSHDIYIYNFLSEQSGGEAEFGTYNFFVRKSQFISVKSTSTDFAFYVPDWDPAAYRYVQNVTILDTVFSGVNKGDIAFFPAGSGIINAINCLRKNDDSSIKDPDSFISNAQLEAGAKPEVRHYVWLDVLVKDQSGHLIKDANVTVEGLTDPAAPTLKVTLPPPPPDLWDLPEEYLPQPVLEGFVRMKTLSTGKLPGPNYGWSANSEPCVAMMHKKISELPYSGGVRPTTTAGYQYRITARYHGLEASTTVTPDATWLQEDPTVPSHTVELVLNGDATAGTDTTLPNLTITSPVNNKPVYGATAIAATASDNWDIEKLEIFIDNVSRAVIAADSCTWTADSYTCSWNWNTAQESDGVHNIKVVAHDISGNVTERTVTVEVLAHASETGNKAIVYPNPYIKGKSRGSTCTFANLEPDATVRVYTISGDLVTTLTAQMNGARASAEWDVSKIGGGIYLYTVHSSKGVQKGKIGIVK